MCKWFGIVAKNKVVQEIKNEIKKEKFEIIEITNQSLKNLKNIKFEYVIFLENIIFNEEEYKYMNKIISKAKYLIINGDIEIEILKKIKIEKKIKLITFGFNLKSTITISSISDEKIIVCFQRNIEKNNGELIEYQEKQIIKEQNEKNIYNKLVVFIIKELHNL